MADHALYKLQVTALDTSASAIDDSSAVVSSGITNTGNISDSYDIALSGHSWDSTASMSQMGALAPGETAQFTVRVAVPADALPESSDLVLVQVASVADDEITAVWNLTTAVLPQVEFNLYLPLVTQP